MWPFEAVEDFMHPSVRKRRVEQNSSGGEEEGRSRGRLTDGLSSSSLAPTCVSQVSCLLSETSDSRQGWHDQRAGPCWTGQPSVLWRDRHVAVISL
ncbi:hypothetical protein JOQ06_002794 [Pogonophryne albipinna]|uniref:Uncharacterized protein n=1 Tax=Pogonophryne albipinna TaxID=1090488 RepID=A0AAD6B7C3_9TELE|nr:hypothetical protein JOQ06_002794 [Pogonophryne albipinna]